MNYIGYTKRKNYLLENCKLKNIFSDLLFNLKYLKLKNEETYISIEYNETDHKKFLNDKEFMHFFNMNISSEEFYLQLSDIFNNNDYLIISLKFPITNTMKLIYNNFFHIGLKSVTIHCKEITEDMLILLNNCPNLTNLSLDSCTFSCEVFNVIKNQNIKYLDFSRNDYCDAKLELLNGIDNLKNLNTFVYNNVGFICTKCDKFIEKIINCKSLEYLDIRHNILSNEDILNILNKLTQLKTIYLRKNGYLNIKHEKIDYSDKNIKKLKSSLNHRVNFY